MNIILHEHIANVTHNEHLHHFHLCCILIYTQEGKRHEKCIYEMLILTLKFSFITKESVEDIN